MHQHLVRQKSRTKVALVVESGDAREVHHVALLLGYGAGAVNPYLVLESAEDLSRHGLIGDVSPQKAIKNTVYALGKGVLKVMSKMGISTVGSYRAAQVFAVFGIDQPVLDEYFTGSTTRTGGSGLETIAVGRGHPARAGLRARTRAPWSTAGWRSAASTSGAARARSTCSTRRPSTCCSTPPAASSRPCSAGTPRPSTSCPARAAPCAGCSSCAPIERASVPLDEVEPATEIVKRFVTGAMSYGSISVEAHRRWPSR